MALGENAECPGVAKPKPHRTSLKMPKDGSWNGKDWPNSVESMKHEDWHKKTQSCNCCQTCFHKDLNKRSIYVSLWKSYIFNINVQKCLKTFCLSIMGYWVYNKVYNKRQHFNYFQAYVILHTAVKFNKTQQYRLKCSQQLLHYLCCTVKSPSVALENICDWPFWGPDNCLWSSLPEWDS